MNKNLLTELQEYSASDYYPLHMPGHKRNIRHFQDAFGMDITEIAGFDNLFHAEGVLLEAQQRAARLYGADETFYLVNGSTCGILAAVSACTRRGSQILMSRNCHKAAYHAVLLNNLQVKYLYPSVNMEYGMNGSISVEEVRNCIYEVPEYSVANDSEMIGANKVRAVLITSPTYDGVVSDIAAIADVVHEAGAVLIVDEAHGAHFAMSDYFPQTALELGADIVINSLHKTLPSLTQTALLHVKGDRVDRSRLKKYLGIYQSSSPSYLLMAGMDACVCQMQEQKETLFAEFIGRLEKLRHALENMRQLYLVNGSEKGLDSFAYDCSKIIISTAKCSLNGPQLGQLLREEWHLEPEMEAEQYVTAIMTVADTQEGFDRLEKALLTIDRQLLNAGLAPVDFTAVTEETDGQHTKPGISRLQQCLSDEFFQFSRNGDSADRPEQVLTICQADEAEKETIRLDQSAGRISGEFVYLYPPGIPLLVPGERIPAAMPEQIRYYHAAGLHVQGLKDYTGRKIQIIKK